MSSGQNTDEFLDFIGDEFFVEIVENKLKLTRDEFKLKLVLLTSVCEKNENFTSQLYRARIKILRNDGSPETVQVIIKVGLNTLPPEFKEFGVFYHEKRVYEDMIPSFEKLLGDAGISISFGPKSFKFESEPYEVIVLDDLQTYQYVIKDRKVGLGLDDTKTVFSKLAKFHAASAMRFEQEGIIHKELNRRLFFPPMPEGSPFYKTAKSFLDTFCKKVLSWPGYEHYEETFKDWHISKYISSLTDVANPMKSGFMVLNHADLWVNNLMFQENGNVAFIDFQGSFWGSPAHDIFYFYVSSVRDNIKVLCFDELVAHYQAELKKSLEALGYPKPSPTIEEINADLLEHGTSATMCLMYILAFAKYDSPQQLAIDIFFKSDDQTEMFENIFASEYYMKAVKIWLPFFKSRGFLDKLRGE